MNQENRKLKISWEERKAAFTRFTSSAITGILSGDPEKSELLKEVFNSACKEFEGVQYYGPEEIIGKMAARTAYYALENWENYLETEWSHERDR
jgi:hypothetical protein